MPGMCARASGAERVRGADEWRGASRGSGAQAARPCERASVARGLGIGKVRFTGGEPFARKGFPQFVADTLAQDTGSVVSAPLEGDDGQTISVDVSQGDIPDADPDGLVLFFQ